MPSISWWLKDGKRYTHRITKAITTIGANNGNDIVISEMELDDHHARIIFDGRDFNINEAEGFGIINVNGKKKRKARLNHEDRITMSNAELIFGMFDFPAQNFELKNKETNQSQIEGLTKLQQFSQALIRRESISDILNELMDLVIELTGAAKGFLVLFEDGNPSIKVARNIQRENLALSVANLSDSIIAQVVKTKTAMIVSDAQTHSQFSTAESVINLNLSSVMCVPLMERGRLMGLIYLGNDTVTGLFEATMLELLKVFAAQASLLVQNALLVNDLKTRNSTLEKELEQQRFGEIIGSSPSMIEIFKKVEKVAVTEVSVLIGGETGTGKELIAREIHRRSSRSNGPFITVNCGAIPETLMESEFFGHVRGAFTGASSVKQGKFQAANKGTIFLDEIGEMPIGLQVKMLRVLQEKQVVKIGSTKLENLDIRIIAATNKNLEDEIKIGTFREDLYYRLNVIHIVLPSLKNRGDDVILLARYLLKCYVDEFETSNKGFTPGAIIAMKKHLWPGNVREMENRLKKAVILCEGNMVGSGDLDLESETLPEIMSLGYAKEQFQKKYILDVLERNNGNRAKTARDLDVDPRTIYRYLEKA